MQINIIIGILLIVGGVVEKILHRARLKKIPIRILVNGTRGKTSVTRLMYAILKENGMTVVGKTTGSDAAILLPNREELAYRKPKRLVSIGEHTTFLKKISKQNVQAMVVECMAIMPENQYMMGEEMVRPTMTIVTNARVDHVAEIGETEEQTVETLALSITKETLVVSSDDRFKPHAKQFLQVNEEPLPEGYLSSFGYPVFAENVQLALACATQLGIDKEVALAGMKKAIPDIGMRGPFALPPDRVFINGFATNEPDSAKMLLQASRKDIERPLYVLYNHRADREYRLKQFLPLVVSLANDNATIFVMGEDTKKSASYFQRKGKITVSRVSDDPLEWLSSLTESNCDIFAIGNIGGAGRELIESLSAQCDKTKPDTQQEV